MRYSITTIAKVTSVATDIAERWVGSMIRGSFSVRGERELCLRLPVPAENPPRPTLATLAVQVSRSGKHAGSMSRTPDA